jgi:hypothetical protein
MMKNKSEQILPEARHAELIVQELADEVLIYDEQQHKAHCLNQTAAVVWKQCDGTRDVSDIARRASLELGAPVGEEMVWLAVDELSKRRLLKEKLELGTAGTSRREMMRRLGVGAAVALPLVVSIVAPRAADAANLLPPGAPCSSPAQCSSSICNAGTCA